MDDTTHDLDGSARLCSVDRLRDASANGGGISSRGSGGSYGKNGDVRGESSFSRCGGGVSEESPRVTRRNHREHLPTTHELPGHRDGDQADRAGDPGTSRVAFATSLQVGSA